MAASSSLAAASNFENKGALLPVLQDDNMSTIAGGSVDSDVDDMTTEKSDASRLSKSRTAASRGSTRKQNNREKYLNQHLKVKAEAEGKVWIQVDKEDFKEQQRKQKSWLSCMPQMNRENP